MNNRFVTFNTRMNARAFALLAGLFVASDCLCDLPKALEFYKQGKASDALAEISAAVRQGDRERIDEVIEDWHNFGRGNSSRVSNESLLTALAPLIEGASPRAQWLASRLWLYGQDGPCDPRPYQLLVLAANGGNAEAAWALGNRVYCATLPDNGSHWIFRAGELGHLEAQRRIVGWYLTGEKRDPRDAFRWARALAQRGDPSGMAYLGSLYLRGEGVEQNYLEAAKWLKSGYEAGARANTVAAQIATIYERGLGVTPNPEEAAKWRQREADLLRGSLIKD